MFLKKKSLHMNSVYVKKDNLTHWDRYAAGCTGVCIGFNISALRVHMQRLNSTAFGMGLYDVGKFFMAQNREKYKKNLKKLIEQWHLE